MLKRGVALLLLLCMALPCAAAAEQADTRRVVYLTFDDGPKKDTPELLDALEAAGGRWGIVTTKPEYLARQVLPALGWDARCAVLVGGDSLPERKPHPLPLLHAADTLGVAIADCAYVGDDRRDIDAARAAGMRSVVALWGYRLPGERPAEWGGDVLAEVAADLLDPLRWP